MNRKKIIDPDEIKAHDIWGDIDVSNMKVASETEQQVIREAAGEYLRKESKMNIRIEQGELEKIREFARQEGMKYQTLVKSVLHKYITGQLIEKRHL